MIKVLMLGGTGAIGESILSVIGDDEKYKITVTSRKERFSKYKNVQYVCGNANEQLFINSFQDGSYDVLIDFMNYRNEVLEKNISKLIKIADQYIFLSSARVYDNSKEYIDEGCSFLLDTTNDEKFKLSGTYAVKKAWQERLVLTKGENKVTIIRPYKTYSSERLQLGEYEIKHWLNRIVNGKPIVVNRNILTKKTALTSGVDVANGLISLMGNKEAFNEDYQIVTDESMTWNEILNIYCHILKKHGFHPVIYLADDTRNIDQFFENGYQMTYDILYDRKFKSTKISPYMTKSYEKMKVGLERALECYLNVNRVKLFKPTLYDEIVDDYINKEQLVIWEER